VFHLLYWSTFRPRQSKLRHFKVFMLRRWELDMVLHFDFADFYSHLLYSLPLHSTDSSSSSLWQLSRNENRTPKTRLRKGQQRRRSQQPQKVSTFINSYFNNSHLSSDAKKAPSCTSSQSHPKQRVVTLQSNEGNYPFLLQRVCLMRKYRERERETFNTTQQRWRGLSSSAH